LKDDCAPAPSPVRDGCEVRADDTAADGALTGWGKDVFGQATVP
jgi:hypothetical protein